MGPEDGEMSSFSDYAQSIRTGETPLGISEPPTPLYTPQPRTPRQQKRSPRPPSIPLSDGTPGRFSEGVAPAGPPVSGARHLRNPPSKASPTAPKAARQMPSTSRRSAPEGL